MTGMNPEVVLGNLKPFNCFLFVVAVTATIISKALTRERVRYQFLLLKL
jgi:hypothetical protein